MGKPQTSTEGQWPEVMKSAAHQYEDKLLEFAYGELPQHEAEAVDAHVRGCNRCSQSLCEIRAVRATMARLPMETAPDAGLDSLVAYAEQAAGRNRTKPATFFWKRLLMPLASLAALATVGVIGFRANEEFDTSPASAIAQGKIEERAEAEAKVQLGLGDATEAPVAAAAPESPSPEPVEEERANRVLAAKDSNKNADPDDLRGAGGKRAEVWSPEPKRNAPQSVTRRAAKTEPIGNNDQQVYRDDYSNAAQRGGLTQGAKEAPPPPPAGQDKVGYGLGSGPVNDGAPSGTTGGRSQPEPFPVVVKAPDEKQKRAKSKDERPVVPAPAAAPAPMPSSASSAPPMKKSAPKGGYGIRPQLGDTGSLAAGSDDAALEKSDSLRVDNDAKFAQRRAAETRSRSLESARVASSRGDRVAEIRLLAQVLQSGAAGSERVEALKRICDAYEALGEAERADPFCDQLLSEFPNTAAARAVEDRRKRMQRAPAPAQKRSASEQKLDLEEASKPQPAQAVPSQSY